MRRFFTFLGMFTLLAVLSGSGVSWADDKHPAGDKHDAANKAKAGHGKDDDHGHGKKDVNPLEIRFDTALWSIVVFVLLLIILRKAAWGPILEGLRSREQTIAASIEDAKKIQAEMRNMRADFESKLAQEQAKIPAMMEEARRDAEALRDQMKTDAAAANQAERQRLMREIATAKDQAVHEIWNQAAQLATLISAKAIGRSLTEDDHRRLLQEALDEMASATQRN